MNRFYSEHDKSIEHELKQSRDSLDFALKSAGMGTWDIDLHSGRVMCSPDMLEMWGVTPEDFSGDRNVLQEKVHPDDRERMREAIDSAIHNRDIYELEYRIFPEEGIERWVRSRGRCTYAPNSDIPVRFSGVVFDITENKMKENALKMALIEREHFLNIAGHELRTPITCLQLQLQVMEWEIKKITTSPEIEFSIRKQKDQFVRINRIIENIFERSVISEGKLKLHLQTFNLVQLIENVTENFRSIANVTNGTVITFEKQCEKVEGKWDMTRIEQVLLNLLLNALRFGNHKPVHVKVGVHNNLAFFCVHDAGAGIKQEDHERIFQRYGHTSGDREASGLGLGLYLSREIVKAHGGSISVNSTPEKGSLFTVTLPF